MCKCAIDVLGSLPGHHNRKLLAPLDAKELAEGARWAAACKQAGFRPGQLRTVVAAEHPAMESSALKVAEIYRKRFLKDTYRPRGQQK